MKRSAIALLFCNLLFCSVLLRADAAFFPKEFNGVVSVQSLIGSECTLKEFYFADTTISPNAGFIPMSASAGMDFAFFYGYVHSLPRFVFETSLGGEGEGFWGFGGALAFEGHPFRESKYDPYVYCNFGLINMSGRGYDGHGYHIDVGGGVVLAMKPTIKVSPFIAYTPISTWVRRRQVGYIIVDPIIGPEPAYEGRMCKHSGMRFGISVLFNIFGK